MMASVDMDQLRFFEEVALRESFAKAADALFISRNGLTYKIKQMEQELGFDLFERDSHHVSLTPQGRALRPKVNEILGVWNGALQEIAAGQLAHRELRVGMMHLLDEDTNRRADELFRKAQPDVEIVPTFMPLLDPTSYLGDLAQNRLDVVYITEHEVNPMKTLDFVPLCPAYYGVLCREDHPFAALPSLAWEDLDYQDLVLPSGMRHPENRWHMENALSIFAQHCPNARLHFAGDFSAEIYIVEHGKRIGIVSFAAGARSGKEGLVLRPIIDDSIHTVIGLAVTDGPHSAAVLSYINACIEAYGATERRG